VVRQPHQFHGSHIVTRVFVVNLVLAALALITIAAHNIVVSLAMQALAPQ
jgi:hypothetical protein